MLEPRLSKFGQFLQSSLGWPLRSLLVRRIALLQQMQMSNPEDSGDLLTQKGWIVLPQAPEQMALRLPELLAVARALEGRAGWAGPAEVLAWLPETDWTRARFVIPQTFAQWKAQTQSQPQEHRSWSWWLGGQTWWNGLLALGVLGSRARIAMQGECLDIPNLRVLLEPKAGELTSMRTVVQLFRSEKLEIPPAIPARTQGSLVLSLPNISPESRAFRQWISLVHLLAAKERLVVACRSHHKDKAALVLGNPGFGIQVASVEGTMDCERLAKNCRLWIGEPSVALVRAGQLGCQVVVLRNKLPEGYSTLPNVRCVGGIKSIVTPSQILSP
jgi:hypothetical protein